MVPGQSMHGEVVWVLMEICGWSLTGAATWIFPTPGKNTITSNSFFPQDCTHYGIRNSLHSWFLELSISTDIVQGTWRRTINLQLETSYPNIDPANLSFVIWKEFSSFFTVFQLILVFHLILKLHPGFLQPCESFGGNKVLTRRFSTQKSLYCLFDIAEAKRPRAADSHWFTDGLFHH